MLPGPGFGLVHKKYLLGLDLLVPPSAISLFKFNYCLDLCRSCDFFPHAV